jgi:hypothetical protein
MPLYGDILRENFLTSNSINCQINSDLEPLEGFGINFWGHILSDKFIHILEND